ncbi:MAG: hypothetical protein ACJA0K_003031 [Maricaulis maris]|jgi:hypothetical protein
MAKPSPTYQFRDGGTIPPPGPIGRLSRLIFGAGAIYWAAQLFRFGEMDALTNAWVIGFTAFAVHLAPYTLNIGLGFRLGLWPRLLATGLLIGSAAIGWQSSGEWINSHLWSTAYWLNIYVYLHLGSSFFLAALFGTPGCEMRAIPILVGRIAGRETRDHECPGPIGAIDQWERSLKSDG